jgi:hypothetical protein
MHVEALSWSGLIASDYAAAHHIAVYSLRTWRARLDADPAAGRLACASSSECPPEY